MSRRNSNPGCLGGLLGIVVLTVLGWVVFAGADSASEPTIPATPKARPSASKSASPAKKPRARDPSPEPTQLPRSVLPFVDIAAAKEALPLLSVKGRAPLTDYDRDLFGTPWSDVNDNGCDTRNDILRRDLIGKVVEDCIVLSGVLNDPYSGQQVMFTRGPVSSMDVQIDHVVALANAWQTGAKYWSDEKRELFANDRRNLLAVWGDLNLQKRDGDAATWLPPKKSFRCTYVSMQILTKQRYDLWVTPPENQAMVRTLDSC